MPLLIIEQPGVSTQTVPIGEKEIVLGRSTDCDIVLYAEEISRHHAKIFFKNGAYVIADLKSLNGTYVNRQRIVEHRLKHLDEIWLGSKCRIVFRSDVADKDTGNFRDKHRRESKYLKEMEHVRAEIEEVKHTLFKISKEQEEPTLQKPKEVVTPSIDIKKLSRAYRRLDALYKATQIMSSADNLDTRLAQVLDLVIEVIGAERGFILLKDESRNTLVTKVARSMSTGLEATSPSMGIASKAAIEGEPVLMMDRSADVEFGSRESIVARKITSAMCVPLRVEDRILGSIYIDTIKKKGFFDEEDLELFCSMANQIAFAIENAKLNQKMIEEERKRDNFRRFLPDVVVRLSN